MILGSCRLMQGSVQRHGGESGVLEAEFPYQLAPAPEVFPKWGFIQGAFLPCQAKVQRLVSKVGGELRRIYALVAHQPYRLAAIPMAGRTLGTSGQRPNSRDDGDEAEWEKPEPDGCRNQVRSRMMLLAASTVAVQVGGTTVVESYSSIIRGPCSVTPARLGRETTSVSAQPRLGPK